MSNITNCNNLESDSKATLTTNMSSPNTLDNRDNNNSTSNIPFVLMAPCSDSDIDTSYRTNRKEWTRDDYNEIYEAAKSHISDKKLMERYDIKNRQKLESILYNACLELGVAPIKLYSETFASNKERPLRPLKVAADGSLRISGKQLKRAAGLDLGPGAVFELERLNDGRKGFILLVHK